ncbi:MAG: CDP-diacylglycerol--glycerol-3-phosphate 3-phosphatidyltransferase [Deltaproteobacteria bacterium]|nr:CDP-diacylglycerol--glycerol-3-phosphate 3-phosphatidyltransferase [Deltaproteobacteria bacterium]
MTRSDFNIPNALTLTRIILVPVLFTVLLKSPGKFLSFVAALIFGLASITDFLDGYLARRMNLVTTLGKFLDPLADKLLVGVALIMMIQLDRVAPWIVALIVGREILVISLRMVAVREHIVIETTKIAKFKTGFQIAAVIGLLIHYGYRIGSGPSSFVLDFHALGTWLLYIALVITLWSGADYFYKFIKLVSESRAPAD